KVATEPDPAIYNADTPWPGTDSEEVGTQSKRGFTVFMLNLFPLQYAPATRQVSYAGAMHVEIALVDAAPARIRPAITADAELKALVDNPADLAATSAAAKSAVDERGLSGVLPLGGPYDHVIVTTPELEAAPGPNNLQALRDARARQGYRSVIVTTDWIYANYDGTRPDGGTDNPTSIRNFLIDAYTTWGTQYVLLAGAHDLVPPRHFSITIPGVDFNDMPVDMYYGCVEPAECTFDGDADGLYGEPTDGPGGADVDLLAEMYVGRAAVIIAAELAAFVEKTLTYNQSYGEYLKHVSMMGEHVGFGGVSEYGTASMEEIRLGSDAHGYSTVGFANHTQPDFFTFDTSKNLYESPDYQPQDYDEAIGGVLNILNNGVHIVNHFGHSNPYNSTYLWVGSLEVLTNPDPFFMYSVGCNAGHFDVPYCFAQSITTLQDAGAFAVIMNARYGFAALNSTDGPSMRFNRQFWDAVLGERILELGRANQDSKEDNLWDIDDLKIRWCYYELHLFGDPLQKLRVTRACDWFSVNPESGTAPGGGEAQPIAVTFQAGALRPGVYEGRVIVQSDDVCAPALLEPTVRMTVQADDLAVTPETGLDTTGLQGGPFTPMSASYTVENNGTNSVDWIASATQPWLDVAPAGGILAPGTEITVTVSLNANAITLPQGNYNDTVSIENAGSGARFTRPVRLTVDEALSLTPGTLLAAGGPEGGPFDPGSQTYTLVNKSETAAIEWSVSSDVNWVNVSPAGGTLTPGETVNVAVEINGNAASLPEGAYAGLVTWLHVGGGAQLTRPVQLSVQNPPTGSFAWFPLDVDPGWTMEGDWAFGMPQGGGSCPDPTFGHTGVNVYGYNLMGSYSDSMPAYSLTTTALDCSGYEEVQLSFWRWLGLGNWDGAVVEASNDGLVWIPVWNARNAAYCEGSWTERTYDISAVADGQPTVYVRWTMGATDEANAYGGWNIDDIALLGKVTDDLHATPKNGLDAFGQEGGPFLPVSITYTLTNTGAAPLDWTGTPSQPWLDVTPAGGTLAPAGTVEVAVAFNAAAAALAPGAYLDTVSFTNTGSGFTRTRPVQLELRPAQGDIAVLDSIVPEDDLDMPFGDLEIGSTRTEHVTVTNTNPERDLTVADILLGRQYTADFTDTRMEGWVPSNPACWSLTDGEYRLNPSIATGESVSMYMARQWQDCSVGVTIRQPVGGQPAVVFLRASADFRWTRSGGQGSAYGALLNGNGDFTVFCFADGALTILGSWWSSMEPDIEPVEVVLSVEGSNINAYLGGLSYLSVLNTAIPGPGYVGVGGFGDVDGAMIHCFSNFHVDGPVSGEPPVPADTRFRVENVPALPLTLPAGGSAAFDVVYEPHAVGTAVNSLSVLSDDIDSAQVTVSLSGTLLPDRLSVSPKTDAFFWGPVGGPFSPGAQTYTLTNTGTAPLDWTATYAAPWIEVVPSSMTLDPGSSADILVRINENAEAFTEGAYTDAVTFTNLNTGVQTARPVRLTVSNPPSGAIAWFPLDEDPGWTTEGDWAFGVPQGAGLRTLDPTSGYTGLSVYGYNLAGDYSTSMHAYSLTTTAIDCSQYVNVTLDLWRWLGVESSFFDHAKIEVSNDGTRWTTVWENSVDHLYDGTWVRCTYDISAMADRQPAVYVRWVMGGSDNTVEYCGWNIDDVA
ncbi:MAG: hypothetical protein QG656_1378, partial [Candidatus Hydrogenedentes bacterium]|nr:hypothetical protein [Candidatus Hydrogenedentota bacterium]